VTSLRVKEVKVGIPEILELGFEIKNNPTARSELRQHLQPRTTALLEAMNAFIDNAKKKIQNQGYAGLVIIVDNLDRVLRTPMPGLNRNYQEELFITCAPHLTSPRCHIIYTVPPALIYSPNGAHLMNLYGTQYRMLPMVPVTTRQGASYTPGVEKLRESILKRLAFASVLEKDVFDSPATMERLSTASGGYVRNLMALTRNALLQGGDLPIKREAVEFAILQARQGFEVGMRDEHWDMLRTVAHSQEPVAEEACLQMLDNLALLGYYDKEGMWFNVHPVLRESPKFSSRQTTSP
jgi:hypothetical protein